ncbi:MAG: glycoside hydrolase family 2 protein [Clostridia bacterium]|nr:glycoside hydrolase family 2 protein [Clostridia bacterium]
MKTLLLSGQWTMRGNGYAVNGLIPGSVYSFLYLDNKLLPDPYYRDNEDLYLELANHEYVFEKVFTYTPSRCPTDLVFEGLDTLCSIYLNGEKIADTDNMHVRYAFDVTTLLKKGINHLQVVFHPVPAYLKQKNKEVKLFGANDCMAGYPHLRKAHCMMGWDWGPRLPDAGIWKDVYLVEKNSAQILNLHVTQRHKDGRVFLTPTLQIDGDAEMKITLTAPNGKTLSLPANTETEIENPCLWWPNGMGEQALYTLIATLLENGIAVDEKQIKIGLRELKLIRQKDDFGESFYHEINGRSMFAMGADYIPEDNIFCRITPERTRTLLTHCRDSHFNAIRVWGGGYYPDDFFFDLCDELGLVVFFDLMFACSVYEPTDHLRDSIVEEVTQNLTRIRHHACLGLICGNNEIEWHFHEYVAISGRTDVEHLSNVYLDLFENLLPQTVKAVAPYLPYIPSSPTSVGGFRDPNGEGYGDCHDWEPNYLVCRNRFYRYVSEFGFEGFPCMKTIEGFTLPEDRNVHSQIMDRHQRSFGGNELILTYLTRNYLYPNDFATFIYASQLLQAEAVKYKVEHFRRHRGRCMGTLYWQLNDIWPVTSWASIDYGGRFKGLQYMAKRFYAPILLSCEEVGEMQNKTFINLEPGLFNEEKSARFCVTNDTMYEMNGTIRWELRDADSDILQSKTQEVCVDALSAKWLDKIVFEGLDPKTQHLHFTLEVNGEILSEATVLFTVAKYHRFQNPHLRYELENNVITIHSDCYAKAVQIEGIDGDLLLEDSFFDMEKGEKRIRILSGTATKLSLRSVYDIR